MATTRQRKKKAEETSLAVGNAYDDKLREAVLFLAQKVDRLQRDNHTLQAAYANLSERHELALKIVEKYKRIKKKRKGRR